MIQTSLSSPFENRIKRLSRASYEQFKPTYNFLIAGVEIKGQDMCILAVSIGIDLLIYYNVVFRFCQYLRLFGTFMQPYMSFYSHFYVFSVYFITYYRVILYLLS